MRSGPAPRQPAGQANKLNQPQRQDSFVNACLSARLARLMLYSRARNERFLRKRHSNPKEAVS